MIPIRKIDNEEFRYPPDPKYGKELIYCLVVEKRGDNSGNTMKQLEIYCYSPQIRTGSGCIIMPNSRSNWNQYQLGDWLACEILYADSTDPTAYQEKSLDQIQHIPKIMRYQKQLPYTIVHEENVQIMVEFVRSPGFIKNNYLKSPRWKNIHKIIMWKMGMAYATETNFNIKNIMPDLIYRGIFAFRSRNDGGVNFCPALKDKYDMPLERDTFWELVEIVDYRFPIDSPTGKTIKTRPIQDSKNWTKFLNELKSWSKEYAETIEINVLKTKPSSPPKPVEILSPPKPIEIQRPLVKKMPPKLPPKMDTTNRTITSSILTNSIPQLRSSATFSSINNTFIEGSTKPQSSASFNQPIFNDMNTKPTIDHIKTLEEKQNDVIRLEPFHVGGDEPEYYHIDTETGEKSKNRTILIEKFNDRHGYDHDTLQISFSHCYSSTPKTSPKEKRKFRQFI